MPYFFSNACGERLRLGRRQRRVEDDAALALRALDEPRVAVGAAIAEDGVVLRRRACAEQERPCDEQDAAIDDASSAFVHRS